MLVIEYLCFCLCASMLSLLNTHGYLPRAMINTILVPVVKSKSGDLLDRNNYRPIALASVVSKVFELMLLNRREQFIYSADNQFSFKSGLSIDSQRCYQSL